MKRITLLSGLAVALAPALAHAGGEIVAPPPPAPAPVQPAPPAPVVAAPPPAPVVADESGPYAALFGGASWRDDADIDIAGFGTGEVDFDTGWVVGGAAGYAFDMGAVQPRAELELSYRENDADEARFPGLAPTTPVTAGETSALSGMANAWVDVPIGPLKPYAGGGVGVARVKQDEVTIGNTAFVDDNDTVFAWQLGGGVAYEFTPSLAATVDYRWFNTDDTEFNGVETEYSSHNVMGGLRLKF